jgi:hypothetical protein
MIRSTLGQVEPRDSHLQEHGAVFLEHHFSGQPSALFSALAASSG